MPKIIIATKDGPIVKEDGPILKEILDNKVFVDNEVAQSLPPEMKAIWEEMFVCFAEIEEILWQEPFIVKDGHWRIEAATTIASYLLAKVSEFNDPLRVNFEDLRNETIDEDIFQVALSFHINNVWQDLLQLLTKHPYNIFQLTASIKHKGDGNPIATPDGVAELATRLLKIHAEDTVAELCCGTGYVIESIKEAYPMINATGYEINQCDVAVAKARNEFSSKKVSFAQSDVFELVSKNSNAEKYNKIFANYPFGMRLRELNAGNSYLEILSQKIPSISKATSSDWLYNMLMTELLSENGKAIGIMTNGSTWNMIDAPIRKYFVENGLVECVISLPAKLFRNTAIATSMIILSHGNNGVRLVDASSQYTAGRRINELTKEDIDTIAKLITEDSEKSIFVTTEKIRENDYVLNISRYLSGAESFCNGVAFETIIKRITRGAPLNANQLDSISSSVPTDKQYLMLSNIQNGLIDINLPYLTEIDKRNEKYCLTNRCLILSKNGYPYKIAVAEINAGQKIMANGNLYLIELDEEKANPYYIAAFLGSEYGIAALKSITVGATIPNIGVDQLKKLMIPLPDLEKQNSIAANYLAARDELSMLQLKIEKARNRLTHVFEEEV